MYKNFWNTLPKPFLCLAPMEGVTDTVFRQMMVRMGKPEVMFTEFTSVDGLCSKGFEFVKDRLIHTEKEKPLVAQIWGLEPDYFQRAGELLVDMGFDGVDVNFGCPDRAVLKMGAGSAMVKDKPKAAKLIMALKKGVAGKLPISVKIRTGYAHHETEEWVRYLLDTGIDALIVHGRTTKQLSKVPADWEEIVKAVKVRDRMGVGTLIIGNGDIRSNIEANARIKESGADGVMIGRGVFEDPMVFAGTTNFSKIRVKEKLQYYLDHIRLFRETYGDKRYFAELRKFAKVYIQGYRGAKNLRTRVMRCKSMTQMELELQNAIHREDT